MSKSKYTGMTLNERLFSAGLTARFDEALSIDGEDGEIAHGDGADLIEAIALYFNTMIDGWKHDPPRPAVVIDSRAAVTA